MLTFLEYEGGFIRYKGAKALAKALKKNKSLTSLDLSGMFPSPYGC